MRIRPPRATGPRQTHKSPFSYFTFRSSNKKGYCTLRLPRGGHWPDCQFRRARNAQENFQIDTALPIIHGVLLFENEDQARERCLNRDTNRGLEAARTARAMVEVMGAISKSNM